MHLNMPVQIAPKLPYWALPSVLLLPHVCVHAQLDPPPHYPAEWHQADLILQQSGLQAQESHHPLKPHSQSDPPPHDCAEQHSSDVVLQQLHLPIQNFLQP